MKTSNVKHYCVISHTHWDREWYMPHEQFRLKLIDLIDHLLEILDENPEYIFHMDAQTIVFEDYFEVKPENKEKCCKYIREKRILVGPWYVQNDFYLTSGEATVRNLLLGTKQAEELGYCSMNGYTPDQFGLVSQLPQIFKGFEVDHCIFGRGYARFVEDENGVLKKKRGPSEFLWKGADGSSVLAICMSYWYNNAQRFSADIDKAYRLTQNIKSSFEGIATTPYLLLMNGVDHLEAQPDLLPILEEIQKGLPEGEEIYQTTLDEYVRLVRGAIDNDNIHVEEGELLHGDDGNTLKDTSSARIYLKTANAELQNVLEHRLEPLYTYLELNNIKGVYPASQIDFLWKMLIKNHAHDSICGCSTDAVHRHMEDRFEALTESMQELQRRGMAQLAAHAQTGCNPEDYQIVVFNGLERKRTEVITVTVDIVKKDQPKGLRIVDEKGVDVPFEIIEHRDFAKAVFSPINLPGVLDTVHYRLRLLAKDVPAFGYAVYRVITQEETIINSRNCEIAREESNGFVLENEHLMVSVDEAGRVNLQQKENGHIYEDLLTFKDTADVGTPYVYRALKGDKPIYTDELIPQVQLLTTSEYTGIIHIHYDVVLPAFVDSSLHARSSQMVTQPLDVYLELKKESKSLDVSVCHENKAMDHRLDLVVRTGLKNDYTYATSPYDIVKHNKWEIDKRITNETRHNSGMVSISEGERTFAVLNKGVYAYENLQDEKGALTFPVVRATGFIGEMNTDDGAWDCPENQCLREIQVQFSLLPMHEEDAVVKATYEANAFQNPLMVQCEPVDTRKFTGGRTAVQDTTIAELFYQDPPCKEVELMSDTGILDVVGEELQVTAFRKSFDRSGYIFRFYNGTDKMVNAVINVDKLLEHKIYRTNLSEKERKSLDVVDEKISICTQAKEIVTLFIEK